jgi:hypothetical protein
MRHGVQIKKVAPQKIKKPKSLNFNNSGSKKSNTDKRAGYFFVESTIFLVVSIIIFVLSIIFLEESVTAVVELSVFTTVVESVVVAEEPDPQAAKALTARIVNNFFMLMSLILNTRYQKR